MSHSRYCKLLIHVESSLTVVHQLLLTCNQHRSFPASPSWASLAVSFPGRDGRIIWDGHNLISCQHFGASNKEVYKHEPYLKYLTIFFKINWIQDNRIFLYAKKALWGSQILTIVRKPSKDLTSTMFNMISIWTFQI